ncbi:unnamed protein product [Eruca vesicaria subsp. sativa]|uniref:Uncharacterized protein n=1 Tax=Eruca vesicaria subsp. sativa TaxID=29727 RepID=A0ABC8JK03_ERUVS|nr:unnamed protein product [Eruca vesicaria subsp. sativa]
MERVPPHLFRDKRKKQQKRRCSIWRDDEVAVTSQEPQECALVHGRIMERDYKSKEETVKHLLEQFGITPESTNLKYHNLSSPSSCELKEPGRILEDFVNGKSRAQRWDILFTKKWMVQQKFKVGVGKAWSTQRWC